MTFKCPDCGASLTDDSKFCKYCGAKIDDGVKRMEIKIDKRVEDVAEVKRASYEEKESLLRQKKMQQELNKAKVKRITALAVLVFCVLFVVYVIATNNGRLAPYAAMCIVGGMVLIVYVIASVIRGKW